MEIRPAGRGELAAGLGVMSAAFGVPAARLGAHRWVHGVPEGQLFLAKADGEVVGAAAGVAFGASGWVGGVSTLPRAQRRGIGTALTRAVLAWLTDRGVQTTSLLATDAGRPVYERLGFIGEGRYRELVAPARVPDAVKPAVRPLALGDLPGLRALDRLATGEDRLAMLEAGFPDGLAAPGLAGAAPGVPWPGGPIVVREPAAGAALLDAVWARSGPGLRLVLPAANAVAADALAARGFRPARAFERMRLGPPLDWRPEAIWNVANLFWG